MKKTLRLLLGVPALLSLSVFLAACGDGGGEDTTSELLTSMVRADDQMKYDVSRIEVKPGQRIQIILKNVGTMPKVSMGHNLVVLDGKIDPEQFIEASQTQMANDYVAPELRGHVLGATKLLGPGETGTATFNAPKEPGDYPFLCSFPGHYAIGMKGVLSVK